MNHELPEHLRDLNPPQLEAVCHFEGPILVLAGAGSGKTRVLTRRIAHLVLEHDVHPGRILAVTFTNKATDEMRGRLHSLLGDRARYLWVSTFHSAGLRMLRRHAALLGYGSNFVVYDDDDSKNVIKRVIKELNLDDKRNPPAHFARFIDWAKNNLVSPEQAAAQASDYGQRINGEVYDHYQRELVNANAMDFGDLLANSVRLLRQHEQVLEGYRQSLQFILVDEFQDTNKAQYALLRLLAEPRRNLLVVGDDDQSIYAFRGATIRNILEFERDFPNTKVVKLEQNYRSCANILEAAHAVIEKNTTRKSKKLWTAREQGLPLVTFLAGDEMDEANYVALQVRQHMEKGVPLSDMAVFYRTNAQSRALEEAFVKARIPYRIFGGLKFYDRKEIKDILAYLRLIVSESDNQAFQRVVNTPPRGIGAQSLNLIVQAAEERKSPFMEAARAHASRNKSLEAFVKLIDELRDLSHRLRLPELIAEVIQRSDYGPRLEALKDVTAQSRLENLRELQALGRTIEVESDSSMGGLQEFLDRVSLTGGADMPTEESIPTGPDALGTATKQSTVTKQALALMTLHLAKGLEFRVVFFTGIEEGLVPHYRSLDDPTSLEEERRLCYVGITRAMDTLYLTRTAQRGMFATGAGAGGTSIFREVSRFMLDIPAACFSKVDNGFLSKPITHRVVFDGDSADYDDAPHVSMRYNQSASRAHSRSGSINTYSLIKPADQLANNRAQADLTEGLTRTSAQDLQLGLEVVHPTFGRGVIEQIEGSLEGPPSRIKLAVRFGDSTQPKKLLFSQAKLSLLQ